jgi:hypothetical protein
VAWRKTYDGAEAQRVNKWLASEGVCSRRDLAPRVINPVAIDAHHTLGDEVLGLAPGAYAFAREPFVHALRFRAVIGFPPSHAAC